MKALLAATSVAGPLSLRTHPAEATVAYRDGGWRAGDIAAIWESAMARTTNA